MSSLKRICLLALLPLVLFGSTPECRACPFCDGGPSGTNEVKAAIFGEGFWLHLLALALPFLVVAGVVALVGFGPPLSESLRGLKKTASRRSVGRLPGVEDCR